MVPSSRRQPVDRVDGDRGHVALDPDALLRRARAREVGIVHALLDRAQRRPSTVGDATSWALQRGAAAPPRHRDAVRPRATSNGSIVVRRDPGADVHGLLRTSSTRWVVLRRRTDPGQPRPLCSANDRAVSGSRSRSDGGEAPAAVHDRRAPRDPVSSSSTDPSRACVADPECTTSWIDTTRTSAWLAPSSRARESAASAAARRAAGPGSRSRPSASRARLRRGPRVEHDLPRRTPCPHVLVRLCARATAGRRVAGERPSDGPDGDLGDELAQRAPPIMP